MGANLNRKHFLRSILKEILERIYSPNTFCFYLFKVFNKRKGPVKHPVEQAHTQKLLFLNKHPGQLMSHFGSLDTDHFLWTYST